MTQYPIPTRRLINETAANVSKLLSMMTGMPDAQVEYLFDWEKVSRMLIASEVVLASAEGMRESVGDWYPGCGKPSEGRESELKRLYGGDDDETQ